ncbi:MAG: hypothetical protein AAB778_02120 [Patescibacteria group bacterium]
MSLQAIIFEKREESEAEKKAATTPFPKLELPTPPSEERQRVAGVFIAKVNKDRAADGLHPVDLD